MATLLERLQNIEELDCVLQNWSTDDQREPEAYRLEELIELAQIRLAEFWESGHILNDMLVGDDPEERTYARQQLKAIKAWLVAAKKQSKETGAT